MAAKRMFSIDVVDTDKFLDMPVSTQALYFHFGMRADDDGFVASPRKIVKIANCTNDDLKVPAVYRQPRGVLLHVPVHAGEPAAGGHRSRPHRRQQRVRHVQPHRSADD